MSTINATFEVTDWQEAEFDASDAVAKLTKATVTKTYSGGLEGTSVTEWVMAYADDGTAAFVGIERFRATAEGDTLVLQHVGHYADGAATADLTVVEGAGTGTFAGVTGSGDLRADPAGKVSLTLS
jgi:hypothetical protein